MMCPLPNRPSAALLILLTALLSVIGVHAQGPPPALVRFDAARIEQVDLVRDVTGELRAVKRSDVAAEEEGLIVELTLEEGDLLEAGQVIAKLDDELLQADEQRLIAMVDGAEAVIALREAQRGGRERDLKRIRDLESREGTTLKELDDAETALTEAEAQLSEARASLLAMQAQLKAVRKRLDNMTIRAPFTGVAVLKHAELGEWLSAGDPVIELVSLGEIDAWLDVPERFLPGLRSASSPLTVIVPGADAQVQSSEIVVIDDGDALARTFPVKIRLPNADGVLRPGMSITGKVPTGRQGEGLTISKDALQRNEGGGAYVFFDANGMAAVAPVQVQHALGDRFVVRSEVLREGMRTVVEGNERMFSGQPLQDREAPPGGGPGSQNKPPASESSSEGEQG